MINWNNTTSSRGKRSKIFIKKKDNTKQIIYCESRRFCHLTSCPLVWFVTIVFSSYQIYLCTENFVLYILHRSPDCQRSEGNEKQRRCLVWPSNSLFPVSVEITTLLCSIWPVNSCCFYFRNVCYESQSWSFFSNLVPATDINILNESISCFIL